MKNIFLLILLLTAHPSIVLGWGVVGVQEVAAGGGDSQLYTDAIAVYDFENNGNDTKGTHDLTNNGTATFGSTSPPQGSYYATLNGTSQYFSVADHNDLDISGDHAFSFWVNVTTITNQTVISKFASSQGYRVKSRYINPSTTWVADTWKQWVEYPANSTVIQTTNEWWHIVISFDGDSTTDNVTFWISKDTFGDKANGVTDSSLTGFEANAAALWIGRDQETDTYYLSGNIDEVVLWDLEVTATDAEALFDGTWR